MQQLQVIEHCDRRVLMTSQLAEAFDTNPKVVTRNFQRNKERYIANQHYFSLSGDALRAFKGEQQNDVSLKYVSVLYLWTEEGAWLHAKSLNSEKAWEAYQVLISSYYAVTEQLVELKGDDTKTLALTLQDWEQVQHRLEVLEMQMKEAITLHSGEQKRLRVAVGERVYQLAGEEQGARAGLFGALYASIRERYQVESYRDIKQHQLQDAIHFIANWNG